MACDYEYMIMEYLDGELCREREEELKEHLNTCQSCKDFMSTMQIQYEMLSSAPLLSPGVDFTQKVMSQVHMEKSKNLKMTSIAYLISSATTILLIYFAWSELQKAIIPSLFTLIKGMIEGIFYLHSIIETILSFFAFGFKVLVKFKDITIITSKIMAELVQYYSWEITGGIVAFIISLVLLIRLLNSEKAIDTN